MGPDDDEAEEIELEEAELEEINNCCEDLSYGLSDFPHYHREVSDGA